MMRCRRSGRRWRSGRAEDSPCSLNLCLDIGELRGLRAEWSKGVPTCEYASAAELAASPKGIDMHRWPVRVVVVLCWVVASTGCRSSQEPGHDLKASAMVATYDGLVDARQKDPRKQAKVQLSLNRPNAYAIEGTVTIRSNMLPQGTVIAVDGLPEVKVPKQPELGVWGRLKAAYSSYEPIGTSSSFEATALDSKLTELDPKGNLPLHGTLTLPEQAPREFTVSLPWRQEFQVNQFLSASWDGTPEPFKVPLLKGANGFLVQLRKDSPPEELGIKRLGELRYVVDGTSWKEGKRERLCDYMGGTVIERQFSRTLRVIDRATHSVIFERARSTHPPTSGCAPSAVFGDERRKVVSEPYDDKPDNELIAEIVRRIKAGESLSDLGRPKLSSKAAPRVGARQP